MVTYARDEIISASEITRNFSTVLKELANHTKEKFAISKNNKLEAVVVPIDEYERMKEALDMAEHIEIYNIVKERENQSTITFDELLDNLGVDKNEL
ncbi:MAG: type II toxin-antitoxin system Phd/YefM family antitoxin [Sulfurimonas sp.]|nr:type II toxin-antitoxin system Phd/YefM family antitoxin [Sulfurimonas sp.]